MNEHLAFWINILGIWAVWYLGWRPLVLDELRQVLFTIRDRLFLDAAAGRHGLSFSNPAYIRMRQHLNGSIRFAHRLSVFTILFVPRVVGAKSPSPLNLEIDSLEDGPAKQRLVEVRLLAGVEMLKYMVKSSPICLLLLLLGFVVFGGWFLLRDGIRTLNAKFRQIMDYLGNKTWQRVDIVAGEA